MFSGAAGKIVALDHLVISVVQTVDHSKGCGFDSQRMHALENMHIVLIATWVTLGEIICQMHIFNCSKAAGHSLWQHDDLRRHAWFVFEAKTPHLQTQM